MAKFLSGRKTNLKLGITDHTVNDTVLQTIGKVGIGVTNAGHFSLYVDGPTNITSDVLVGGGLTVSGTIEANNIIIGGEGNTQIGDDIVTRNLKATGITTLATLNTGDLIGVGATFSGNVSIAGTLTYEDVTNVDAVGLVTAREGIRIPYDNKMLQIGLGDDLQLYHQANNSYIKDNGTGSLRILGGNTTFMNAAENKTSAVFNVATSVDLYNNNTLRLQTTGYGVTVYDTLRAPQLDITGIATISNLNFGGNTGITSVGADFENINVTGISTFGGLVSVGGTTGTDGQYLRSTGVGVTWSSFPTMRTSQSYTATEGQTTFNFTYNVNLLDVFLNGVKLTPSEYTASNGSTVVLNNGCFAGDTIDLYSYNVASTGSSGGPGPAGAPGPSGSKGQKGQTGAGTSGDKGQKGESGSGGSGGVTTDSDGNTVAGENAGDNFSGNQATKNTIFGYEAGTDLNTGDYNVLIGYQAGANLTDSSNAVAIGYQALTSAGASRNFQTAVGFQALYNNAHGQECTAVGYQALYTNNSGDDQCAFGHNSLKLSNGANNSAFGYKSLETANNGNHNSAFGSLALQGVNSGNYNSSLGYNAGSSLQSGSNNLILGNAAQASSNSISNEITLGNSSINHLRIPGIGVSFSEGGAVIAGVVTATSFSGDGSNLTNVGGGTTGAGTYTTSNQTAQQIDSLPLSIKSAEYMLHFENANGIQAQKVMVMHDGTTAYSNESAIMFSNNLLVSIDAIISGSNILVRSTPEFTNSGLSTYRFTRFDVV